MLIFWFLTPFSILCYKQKIWHEIKFGSWQFFVKFTKFNSSCFLNNTKNNTVILGNRQINSLNEFIFQIANIFPVKFSAYTYGCFHIVLLMYIALLWPEKFFVQIHLGKAVHWHTMAVIAFLNIFTSV